MHSVWELWLSVLSHCVMPKPETQKNNDPEVEDLGQTSKKNILTNVRAALICS